MDLYKTIIDERTKAIEVVYADKNNIDYAVIETCKIMQEAAQVSSSQKPLYNAKPKLKVWSPQIKTALNIV